MALPIAFGVVAGWLLDSALDTSPAFTLGLLSLGTALAGVEVVIAMRRALSRREDD